MSQRIVSIIVKLDGSQAKTEIRQIFDGLRELDLKSAKQALGGFDTENLARIKAQVAEISRIKQRGVDDQVKDAAKALKETERAQREAAREQIAAEKRVTTEFQKDFAARQRELNQFAKDRERSAKVLADVEVREAKRAADGFVQTIDREKSAENSIRSLNNVSLGRLHGEIQKTGAELQNIGNGVSAVGQRLTVGLSLPIVAAETLGVRFNSLEEDAKTTFTVFLKDGEKANQLFQDLADYADKTPFQQLDVVSAGTTLLQAKVSDLLGTLKDAGDLAAANASKGVKIGDTSGALARLQSGDFGEAFERFRDFGISRKLLEGEGLKFDKSGQYQGSVEQAIAAVRAIIQRDFGGLTDKVSQNFSGQISTLLDTVSRFLAILSQPVFEQLKAGLNFVLPLLVQMKDVFAGLSPQTKTAITLILTFLAALGPGLVIIGGIVTALGALVGAIGFLAAGLEIIVPIALAVVGVFVAVGAGIASLAVLWAANSDGITAQAQALYGAIEKLFGDALSIITDTGGQIISFVRENWTSIVEVVKTAVTIIGGNLQILVGLVNAVLVALKPILSLIVTQILETVKLILQIINGDWRGVWQTFLEIVRFAGNQFGVLLRSLFDIASAALTQLGKILGAKGTEAMGGLKNAVLNGIVAVAYFFYQLPFLILEGTVEIVKAAFQIGKSIWDGIYQGFVGGSDQSVKEIRNSKTFNNFLSEVRAKFFGLGISGGAEAKLPTTTTPAVTPASLGLPDAKAAAKTASDAKQQLKELRQSALGVSQAELDSFAGENQRAFTASQDALKNQLDQKLITAEEFRASYLEAEKNFTENLKRIAEQRKSLDLVSQTDGRVSAGTLKLAKPKSGNFSPQELSALFGNAPIPETLGAAGTAVDANKQRENAIQLNNELAQIAADSAKRIADINKEAENAGKKLTEENYRNKIQSLDKSVEAAKIASDLRVADFEREFLEGRRSEEALTEFKSNQVLGLLDQQRIALQSLLETEQLTAEQRTEIELRLRKIKLESLNLVNDATKNAAAADAKNAAEIGKKAQDAADAKAKIDKKNLDDAEELQKENFRKTKGFFEDTFQTLASRGIKGLFSEWLSSLKDFLLKAAAEIAASKLLQFLSGKGFNVGGLSGGGGQSSGGGIFSNIFGSIFGGGNSNGGTLGGSVFGSGNQGGGIFSFLGNRGGGSLLGRLGGLFGVGASAATSTLGAGVAGGVTTSIAAPLATIPLIGGGTATAGATAAGSGGLLGSLGGFLTNPYTLAAIGAGIGVYALFKLFGGDKTEKKLKEAIKSAYDVTASKDVLKQVKQLGEARFGKGQVSKRIPETIQLEEVKDVLRNYAENTNQSRNKLGISKEDLKKLQQNEDYAENIRSVPFDGFREFGGSVSAGKAYIVGERQPELFIPNSNGYIAPSVPNGSGSQSDKSESQANRVVMGALLEAVGLLTAKLQNISAGEFVAIGAKENPDAFGEAILNLHEQGGNFSERIARKSGAAF